MSRSVHPTAIVDRGARVGRGVRIWHFCHVMAGATIGADAMLGQGCFVGRGVAIGDRTRIQNNVSVFEGVRIEDDVFVGPSVVFTNVKAPRAFLRAGRSARASGAESAPVFATTVVRRGVTIGANATILPGVELGEWCFVGAGALVARDVPAFALVVGVPARRVGWVGAGGTKLRFVRGLARCPVTGERYRLTRSGVRRDEKAAAPGRRAQRRKRRSTERS